MVRLLVICFVLLVVSVNFLIEVVSSIFHLPSDCLDEALEAITFFYLLFNVVCSVLADSLFLLEDQVQKLL